jgi:hypothetical protein
VGNPIPANQTPSHFFNIDAFTSTPHSAGRVGSWGVGIMQRPGMIDVDLRMAKQFTFKERIGPRFEASYTNVWNHSNFAAPTQGAGSNRVGQPALRLDFWSLDRLGAGEASHFRGSLSWKSRFTFCL